MASTGLDHIACSRANAQSQHDLKAPPGAGTISTSILVCSAMATSAASLSKMRMAQVSGLQSIKGHSIILAQAFARMLLCRRANDAKAGCHIKNKVGNKKVKAWCCLCCQVLPSVIEARNCTDCPTQGAITQDSRPVPPLLARVDVRGPACHSAHQGPP